MRLFLMRLFLRQYGKTPDSFAVALQEGPPPREGVKDVEYRQRLYELSQS